MTVIRIFVFVFAAMCFSTSAYAVDDASIVYDLTHSVWGYLALGLFVLSYIFVVLEEKLRLRKSIPVMISAGLIWLMIVLLCRGTEYEPMVIESLRDHFLEYADLFFFLIVAMTYINAMLERGVFFVVRDRLINVGLSYRGLFWLTGTLSFFISPVADNLTTVMVMSTVLLAVGKNRPDFIGIGCINLVVAANAGGAFSPFGDITTLMVWQQGMLEFGDFSKLFLPALMNFLLPALVMSFAIPKGVPESIDHQHSQLKTGGAMILILFLLTILTAILFNAVLGIPAVFGMLMGLGYLNVYSYFLKLRLHQESMHLDEPSNIADNAEHFDMFRHMARAEWDTLFFFYGVILSVAGLGFLGYLNWVSITLYEDFGITEANILVGILSSVVDNIPVMFSVLTMQPIMDQTQWLLVTLTTGVGGSLLSIGSAAGVALMGQARGHYTFIRHLKWSPVIALGYFASIALHLWMQGALPIG